MRPHQRQRFIRIIFGGLFAIAFFFSALMSVSAQSIPGLGMSVQEISAGAYIPTFEKGNLEYAPVFLDGRTVGNVPAFVDIKTSRGNDYNDDSLGAADRSYLIHIKLEKFLAAMVLYSEQTFDEGVSLEAREKALSRQLTSEITEKGGAITVLATFPKNDVPEVMYTVTSADINRPRLDGTSQPEVIAERAAELVKEVLLLAWRERQPEHLIKQAQKAVLVLLGLVCGSVTLSVLTRQFSRKVVRLKEHRSKSQQNQHNNITPKNYKRFSPATKLLSTLSLDQKISLLSLYKTGLFWSQWLLWLLGVGYLCGLFFFSRPLSNWIIGVSIRDAWTSGGPVEGWAPLDWVLSLGQLARIGTPLLLFLLFVLVRLGLKGGDLAIDSLIHRWNDHHVWQRRALRAATLSRAFKAWLRAFVYLLLGLIIASQLHSLGAITQTAAVFLGFFSFALSLASQDLLKDLIAGALILWEDHFAVGDVVCINDLWGSVENMSLRITQLRNLDGELITLPNGSIQSVRNVTSDWSRVNYAVEVNYDCDPDHAIEIMDAIAKQMAREPEWEKLIIEPPEVLGVDNLAHTGILIRIIIKTEPFEQWPVAREYRRRLKKAFDEAGIEIGIPQLAGDFGNQRFASEFEASAMKKN
ncbi:MAG: mechanosensitive ion channel family protein [Cyanobacteria bacterium P01_H01_bin.15]